MNDTHKPRLLDLFCCEGGAAEGYHRAGFDVVGIDNKPQPRYPFEFHQADALDYLRDHGHEFDAIHASPPCQGYSISNSVHRKEYPMLIGDVREALTRLNKPYIIENVAGARAYMRNPITLKGTMFGLKVFRARLFESNVFLMQPHVAKNIRYGRAARQGSAATDTHQYLVVTGNFKQANGYAKTAMGIDWMTKHGMAQAIPPAYTEFIGAQLIAHCNATTA